MAKAKSVEEHNEHLVMLEERKVKALEKIANTVDALTLWFEDIDKIQVDEIASARLCSNGKRAYSQVAQCAYGDRLRTFGHGKRASSSWKVVIWRSSIMGLPKSKASHPACRAPSKSREWLSPR